MYPIVSHGQISKNSNTIPEQASSVDSNTLVYADQFPEVLNASAKLLKDNTWLIAVTLSSTYDTPSRYADAWRVLDEHDNEIDIRILGHDHANEQPFTRSKKIELAEGVSTIFIEGRDQSNGWSGQRFEVTLPSS